METARKTRTSIKSRLTRLCNNIDILCDTPNVSIIELKDNVQLCETRLAEYNTIQASLELLLSPEELEEEIETSETFLDSKRVTLTRAREVIAFDEDNGSIVSDNDNNSGSSRSPHHANLPKLQLPKFNGDHTKFQSFWDRFDAVVHKTDLPVISKFTYLLSLLSGEALGALDGLSLVESNYQIARDILLKRYGRTERIVFCHIQELMNLSFIGDTTSHLWTLYDKLQTHVRSLESLGITGKTYGVILTPLVLHRLPESVRMEWARQGEGKETDLEALLNFLFEEIMRRERSLTFSQKSSSKDERKSKSKLTGSASALLASGHERPLLASGHERRERESTRKPSVVCVVCKGEHFINQCKRFLRLSVRDRQEECKRKNLCFRCLRGNHKSNECYSTKKCSSCGGSHHPLLCFKGTTSEGGKSGQNLLAKSHSYLTNKVSPENTVKHTLLQTVSATAMGLQADQKINILFDSGSDKTYISSACVRKLGLEPVGKEQVSVALFGENKPRVRKIRNTYNLQLKCLGSQVESLVVTESPTICTPIYRPALPTKVVNDLKRDGIQLAEGTMVNSDSQIEIDILVGLDYYWTLVLPRIHPVSGQLSAQETQFGWVLSGSWEEGGQTYGSRISHQFLCLADVPDRMCHKLWELDTIGIDGNIESLNNQKGQNMAVLDKFNRSTVFKDGRYVVHLPWKEGHRQNLMNNETQARKRAVNLVKRLDKDPALQTAYNSVLEEMEDNGIIHEVPREEIHSAETVFYLPHRPVIRENSLTTKIRPVFDASAKGFNDVSLNDCMETGPNLIPSLVEILLRFRRWKFGLTSDITKAFLQIQVIKEDRDVHRFLWDIRNQTRVMRFDRVVFGNTCSPFLLNATVKLHLSFFEDSRVVTELKENLYVDDWLTGADTEGEVEDMIARGSEIMIKGGFPLAKWGSNSSLVSQGESKCFGESVADACPSLKILGMHWSTSEDCFYFKALPMFEGLQFTKRLVLSFIARIYDPLGMLNPFTIMIKILFQDLWRMGLDWDDPLPHELQRRMSEWTDGFKAIEQWKIPRSLAIESWAGIDNMELLCFSDASERAFGCCVYLKVRENRHSKLSLVASRVRVAPLKRITIPRLELLGALLAARLLCFIRQALLLPVDIPYSCYTDSTIVLHWIKADPQRWKQYVRNRVSEIQELTSPSNWKHCSGKDNPADLLTRGISATELIVSDNWLQGPEDPESGESKLEDNRGEELDLSEERDHIPIAPVLTVQEAPYYFIDFLRISNLSTSIRVMGWMLRFVDNLRSPTRHRKKGGLSSEELNKAKTRLLVVAQRGAYAQEIDCLQKRKALTKASSLFKLSPFLDHDGLMRVGGRLQMSTTMTYDEKHPVILPKCHISLLIVRAQHHMMKHAGVSALMTSLRGNYWMIGMRVQCKKVCHDCVLCQRQDARACSQPMAPLPIDRIQRTPPFSICGVDHAGPVYCADTGREKHYILLFTCAVVRAVHLELVSSLSLEDFMLAFRRFCSRRGVPSVIYSDNAKTFKAASSLLYKIYGQATPTWKFSAPLAPTWGGWWERLVRSTKSSLRKSLGKNLVNKRELETILFEVEACVNSRPLTYVDENSEILTPSHFLLGRRTPFASSQTGDIPQSAHDFSLKSEEQENTLNQFWNKWSEDYIRNLPLIGKGKGKMNLEVGSLVLIRDESKPRLTWPLGLVNKLFHGKDGLVRAVSLKTENGELIRAVQKLHKLEVT